MPDTCQCKSSTVIASYRAEINNGQRLRDAGFLSESCEVLFLYGSNAGGFERELCWLEMSEAHKEELDDLMDELPSDGVIAVLKAMQARVDSLRNIAATLKLIKQYR